jgi:hypothetical protein
LKFQEALESYIHITNKIAMVETHLKDAGERLWEAKQEMAQLSKVLDEMKKATAPLPLTPPLSQASPPEA